MSISFPEEQAIEFLVSSQSDSDKKYKVRLFLKHIKFPEANIWHCDCKDFQFRGEDSVSYKCKHIKSVCSALLEILTPNRENNIQITEDTDDHKNTYAPF